MRGGAAVDVPAAVIASVGGAGVGGMLEIVPPRLEGRCVSISSSKCSSRSVDSCCVSVLVLLSCECPESARSASPHPAT